MPPSESESFYWNHFFELSRDEVNNKSVSQVLTVLFLDISVWANITMQLEERIWNFTNCDRRHSLHSQIYSFLCQRPDRTTKAGRPNTYISKARIILHKNLCFAWYRRYVSKKQHAIIKKNALHATLRTQDVLYKRRVHWIKRAGINWARERDTEIQNICVAGV